MNSKIISIEGVQIGGSWDCFVIAEIGHNHQGNIDTCKKMFKAAKEAGASAVKLQKRDNKTLYTKAMYNKPYDNENSFGDTYGAHREFLEFGRDEYIELQKYAKELDIIFFATAFDIPSADFLADFNMPAYKIASGDVRSIPLIKHIASFQKPIIISTGTSTMEDVERVYDAILPINKQICLLQCTAGYPVPFNEMDLNVIKTYLEKFPEAVAGLSSHDSGIAMALAAYVLGARIIEKHFTLNRAMKGTDHSFSLEPVGLRKLVRDIQRAREAIGDGTKKLYESEKTYRVKQGKSLTAAHYMTAGKVLMYEDIAMKSPGGGLPLYELDNIIGKKIKCELKEDDLIVKDILEDK